MTAGGRPTVACLRMYPYMVGSPVRLANCLFGCEEYLRNAFGKHSNRLDHRRSRFGLDQ
jgi:hypothetical protein